METEDNQIHSRLSRVETSYEALHNDVQKLYKSMDSGFSNLHNEMRNMQKNSRTPVGTVMSGIFGVVMLAITMLTLAFAPMYRDINRIETGFLKGVEKLDVNLQREMRDRDEVMETRLFELEKSLNIQNDYMERQIETGARWMDQHDKRVVGLNAAQWERIYALERKIFKEPAQKFGD